MWFGHSQEIWRRFPELVAGVIVADGITGDPSVAQAVAELTAIAEARLASGPESELPEIQAWRRVFRRMGLEPTQYRCAAEALLRRLRKEARCRRSTRSSTSVNATSISFAIPVAVFDVSKVPEFLEVRHAAGTESYLTFSGELETPPEGEVIFADGPIERTRGGGRTGRVRTRPSGRTPHAC
jgi:DNA/RNA-binding domain of Phe-tRNA-synthetase-like protein